MFPSALCAWLQVIYHILGIPFSDYHFLSSNVAVRASASGTARDAATAQQELTHYMDKLVASKEQKPQNDLISDLVVNQVSSRAIYKDYHINT